MSDDTNASPDTSTPPAAAATPGNITPAASPPSSGTWFDSLPDDLKAEPSLQNLKGKDITDVVKGYTHAQKELGSRIRIPGQDASDEVKKEFVKKLESIPGVTKLPDPNNKEEVDAFFNKIGRPSDVNGYKFDVDTNLVNPEAVNQFKQMAHAMGLTSAQANELVKFDVSREQARLAGMQKAAADAKAVLKDMWGGEFDNKIGDVAHLLEHYSSKHPAAVESIKNSDLANNPVLLNMLADLSKAYKESGVIKGDSTRRYGLTPGEADAQIKEILNNPKHDYFSEDNAKRAEAVKKVNVLYEAKNAGK